MRYRKYAKKSAKTESNKELTKEVSVLKSKVSRMNSDIERKVVNVFQNTATSVDFNNPFTVLLNPLSQGTSVSTRLGNKVKAVYVDLTVTLQQQLTTAQGLGFARIMLVREKPSLGSAISLNSLLGYSTPYVQSSYNYTNREWDDRFKVYYDKQFAIDGKTYINRVFRIRKRLGFVTNYARGNTGTISDIDVNSLYLVILTNWNSANNMYYQYDCNLFYEDA